MSASYRVLPAADRDLDDQADYYVREAGLDLGLRFLAAAHETFSLIATRPGIGWKCRLSHPTLKGVRVFRVTGFEKTLVFYRQSPDLIEIIRVLHGARNLDALLEHRGFA